MSRLEELIQEYCPDGVEYVELGNIVEFLNGRAYKQSELLDEGKYKVLRVGNFHTNDKWYYSNLELDKTKYCDNGDLLYTWAATLGPQIWNGGKVIYHYHIWKLIFDEKIISKRFLYHFLTMDTENISKSLTNSTMPHVSMANMKKRTVPVPPLPVQQEIVRILDSFTELTAELQAELQARKKQYEYYRDELLTPKNEISKVKLGEFAEICRGGNFQKKDFVSNGYPCIHYGQIYTHYGTYTDSALTNVDKAVYDRSKKAKSGDIIMAVTSENIEDVCKATAWLGNENIAVSGHTAIIHHQQNPKYLSYYFASNAFFNQKKKLAHGTKVIEVTPSSLANIEVPLPSLEVQNRLVNVLDNFDAICTDLNIGLPAEIEARQKQYEFYRDSLLTFAETGQMISQTDRQTELNAIKLIQYVFGCGKIKMPDWVEYKKLKDVSSMKRGSSLTKAQATDGAIPVISGGKTPAFYCTISNRNGETITVAGSGANAGYVQFWNIPIYANDCFTVKGIKEETSTKYLYYFLTSIQGKISSTKKGSGIPHVHISDIEQYLVPVPPLPVQQEIVRILDRFNTLCNDISSGLPAEIEARQKQYEYYRDKLLSFKEKQN